MSLTLANIVNAAYAELREIAKKEGPDGELLMYQCEFTADYAAGGSVLLQLQFGRDVVWKQQITGITRTQIEMGMTYTDMAVKVTEAMRKTISLVGQVEHARLNQEFPQSIARVEVEYIPAQADYQYRVFFRNGHIAEAIGKREVRDDLFKARCAMIYDLPPL